MREYRPLNLVLYGILVVYITFLLLFLMAEPEVLSEFNDHKLNLTTSGESDKLPRIQRPSRQEVRSKAESRKTPTNLPSLKPVASNPAEPPQTGGSKSGIPAQKDDFALEIEQKLKLVLQNVNQGEIEEGSEEGEDVQFQELIEQNRQKLKNQKQKNDNRLSIENRQQKKEVKRKSKTIKNNGKNDHSLYEKKMKEYREGLNENKYLQRKKDILAHRQDVIDRVKGHLKEETPGKNEKEIKQVGNELVHQKESLGHPNNNYSSNKSVPKQRAPRSAFKQKQSSKNVAKQLERVAKIKEEDPKSANLFDNIHNLLLNPQKLRAASEVKKGVSSNIELLQQKIKLINQKLGVSEELDLKARIKQIEQRTALDWKRLEYNRGSNFRCHNDSNFEKEVDRIGHLQQKSNDYLSKLVSHQKTLVELALIKKIKPGIGANTE